MTAMNGSSGHDRRRSSSSYDERISTSSNFSALHGLRCHIPHLHNTIHTRSYSHCPTAHLQTQSSDEMRTDPFPPWPTQSKPLLTNLEQLKETEFHTLSLQHFTLTSLNEDGTEGKVTHHDYDVVKPKPDCPDPLGENGEWERVLSDPEDLGGLKYKRVVKVHYRHKTTGVMVRRLRIHIIADWLMSRNREKWWFGNPQSSLAVCRAPTCLVVTY